MSRHTIGTVPAQTRDGLGGIVVADEGGGPTSPHPNKGGVCPGSAALEATAGQGMSR